LIQAFRLQGDFRPQMDETVSPVVVIGRLDGGPAAAWPRNLSVDWRGSARSINVSTNPAIWWRFLAPAGHDKAARITRLQLTSMSGAALFAIFRGDLE